jgi:hypothetical protein
MCRPSTGTSRIMAGRNEEYAAVRVEKHRLVSNNLRWLGVSYWSLASAVERDSSLLMGCMFGHQHRYSSSCNPSHWPKTVKQSNEWVFVSSRGTMLRYGGKRRELPVSLIHLMNEKAQETLERLIGHLEGWPHLEGVDFVRDCMTIRQDLGFHGRYSSIARTIESQHCKRQVTTVG